MKKSNEFRFSRYLLGAGISMAGAAGILIIVSKWIEFDWIINLRMGTTTMIVEGIIFLIIFVSGMIIWEKEAKKFKSTEGKYL